MSRQRNDDPRTHSSPFSLDRRTFLKACPPLALSLAARGLFPPMAAAGASTQTGTGPGVIDEALDLLSRYGPEYGGGLSNHAPMAAEALVAMERPDAVIPWVELYKDRLQEPASRIDPVTAENWKEALGEVRRVADWVEFFQRALAEVPWRSVLETWIPRLAPGLVGAAAHCIIRTSHAVRRVALQETPQRLNELAQGLGYWAARYQTLPGAPSPGGEMTVSEALTQVDLLPDELQRPPGLIVSKMLALEDFPDFTEVINLVDAGEGRPDFLADLTAVFARVYLQYPDMSIAFIHAVTGPSALRILAPYVEPKLRTPASQYAWQAAAGIYATFADAPYAAEEGRATEGTDELIDRAVANGNAHVIKFTEVCIREWRISPRPIYLAAARDVSERLSPLR